MPDEQITPRRGRIAASVSLLLLSLALYVAAPLLPCGTAAHRLALYASGALAGLGIAVLVSSPSKEPSR